MILAKQTLREKCPNMEFFLALSFSELNPQGYDRKRKLFRTNNFVFAHSSAKKNLHWITNGKVFNTMVSYDFNMTSFSPCCHNWLACICFCACIYLLSRISEKLSTIYEEVYLHLYVSAPLSWALFDGFICMMEKVNFGYSIKNIPIPSERTSRYPPKEHPDTLRKNILITINGKSRNGNRKNEMESNTFQQQRKYRQ